MRRIVSRFAAALSLAALFSSHSAHAQVVAPPNAINFQGRLATPSGNPVLDGTYSVRFRFYDTLTSGTVLYQKTIAAVAVKNGTFAVLLDSIDATAFNANTWIGITLGTDPELTPRTQIVSVPYALKSTLALTVPDASITNAKLAGSITADKFAANIFNPIAWLLNGNTGVTSGFLGTTDSRPLAFKTSNVERMRILSGGNVGIGTAVPLRRLHIASTEYGMMIGNGTTGGTNIQFGLSGGYPAIQGVQTEGTAFGFLRLNPEGGQATVGTEIFPNVVLSVANTAEYAVGSSGRFIAGGYSTVSDARLKEHIETVPDALSTLLGLRGVTYDWKPDSFVGKRGGKERQYGFLAQEVAQVLPALVQPGLNGYKAVNYQGIIPVTVEAIKTLHARSVMQQSQISLLRKENEGIRSENAAIRAQLDAILKRLDGMGR